MEALNLEAGTAALVLIDLQMGITARPTAPHSSADVIERSARLAERFRSGGSPVVLVHVTFSGDWKDTPPSNVDSPMGMDPTRIPPNWAEFVPQINRQTSDIIITKRQWGAFYGTELDLQLRRRGVKTIVLGGISTNFGVESTARDGWERGYEIVFVEDAMASVSAEAHDFAVKNIFPRLGRVRTSKDVLGALRA